jgi:PQQ-dependent dehydrogenase (methanol/ethanol family)
VTPVRRLLAAVVPAAVATLAAAGSVAPAHRRTAATITPAPAFAPLALARPAAADWPTNGGDYGQTRYSVLAEITKANVGRLRQVWHIHLNGSGVDSKYRGEGTPLVYKGIMYVVTGADDVFAVDATDGTILWQYGAQLPQTMSSVCCGWVSRGLALGDGKVYVARLDGTLVALSQQTGGVVWTASNGSPRDGYTMTMAPLYYDGLVVVGVSGGEFGIRGSVTAYDARDGHRVWRFDTVPGPGQRGSSTWPDDDEWATGGGPVWSTPSVDPKAKLLYFTTGNAYPWSTRGAGDDLFTSSFVALHPETGAYAWHYQVVHHDIWDYDCASNTVLFVTTIAGKGRKVVAEPCKTGWVYELLRRKGVPATPIVERPVPQSRFQHTSRTQPIPAGTPFSRQCAQPRALPRVAADGWPFRTACIFTPFGPRRFTAVAPGVRGGSSWSPASFSPQTGDLYVCSRDTQSAYKAIPSATESSAADRAYVGAELSYPTSTRIVTGALTAIRMSTNRIVWRRRYTRTAFHQLDASCESGSLATAGGLVFTALPQGMYHGLVAYDAFTGRRLWRFHTDAGVEAPPVTYAVGDVQYVAAFAGGRVTHGGTPVLNGDDLYAFALP